jgi:hypothetical protein
VLVNIISPFVAGFNLGTYAPLRYQGMFVSHKSWYSVVSLGHCSLFPSRVGLRTYQHPCSIFLLQHVRVVSLFICKWYCAFGWFNKQTQCPKMDKFMNAKQQLLKTNAAVWFNTICRAKGMQYVGTYWSVHPLEKLTGRSRRWDILHILCNSMGHYHVGNIRSHSEPDEFSPRPHSPLL